MLVPRKPALSLTYPRIVPVLPTPNVALANAAVPASLIPLTTVVTAYDDDSFSTLGIGISLRCGYDAWARTASAALPRSDGSLDGRVLIH